MIVQFTVAFPLTGFNFDFKMAHPSEELLLTATPSPTPLLLVYPPLLPDSTLPTLETNMGGKQITDMQQIPASKPPTDQEAPIDSRCLLPR